MHSLPTDIGDQLERAQSLEDVCVAVRTAARTLADADGATFVLRDGEHCFYVDEDAIAPLWRGQRFPITNCISGWAMLHDEQVAIPQIFLDPRVPHDAYAPTFVRSLMMTPVGSPPAAAIGVYWRGHHDATTEQRDLLEELAGATGAALDRVGLDNAPWAPSRFVRS